MANDVIEIDVEATAIDILREKYDMIESDLNEIQSSLSNVATKLSNHIDVIIEFSDAAQHPKVYEALAKVVSSYAAINREAANILRQKKELADGTKKPASSDPVPTVVDNRSIHFNGTSNDLLDMIESRKKSS